MSIILVQNPPNLICQTSLTFFCIFGLEHVLSDALEDSCDGVGFARAGLTVREDRTHAAAQRHLDQGT